MFRNFEGWLTLFSQPVDVSFDTFSEIHSTSKTVSFISSTTRCLTMLSDPFCRNILDIPKGLGRDDLRSTLAGIIF